MSEPRTRTFMEALADCAIHGELTEEQAREWLEGDDLALALRVIRAPHLHLKREPVCPICDNLGYIGCFCGQSK